MSKQWKNNLQALYKQTRQELPTPELDQKIRLAAQKAVKRNSPNLKWYISSAAVVLLAVNVVLFTYVPESEIVEIPHRSASRPSDLPQPKAPLPEKNVAPAQEPMVDSIESQKSKESEGLFKPDVNRNRSEAKKSLPAMQDYLSESAQPENEEISQPLTLKNFSGTVMQGKEIQRPEHIPFDVKRLIAGNSTLSGQQTTNSLIIYQKNRLILKMTRIHQGFSIDAYPEAQLWGVYAQWGQSTDSYTNCSQQDYLICDLSDDIQGGFKHDRLVFIRWIQKNEP
jgi:hypothetical protein